MLSDCAITGGGPAGLNADLIVGRDHNKVPCILSFIRQPILDLPRVGGHVCLICKGNPSINAKSLIIFGSILIFNCIFSCWK